MQLSRPRPVPKAFPRGLHHLGSVSSADLVVPSTRRSTIGDRAFAVAGPRAWNSLPSDIRTSTPVHHHSTLLRNILNPTSFNCLSLACRACDYVYIDYVRRSRSSSCRSMRPIKCQTYIRAYFTSLRLAGFFPSYSSFVR